MGLLTLQKVYFQYVGTTANVLQDITVSFEAGILYGIIGKSGAGKSTMLSLISGMDLCTDGTIRYQEQDMKQLDRDEYRAKEIGVIFQGNNLLTNATVLDNITLAMEISGRANRDKKQIALSILASVGINEEKAKRNVLKLSGGEQQRVGIARALATEAKVIIADEPTGNLDSDTEAEILDIFTRLAHIEKKCIIIVTHSNHVAACVDQKYCLHSGKLSKL